MAEPGIAAVVPFYAPNDLDALVEGSEQTPNARQAIFQFLNIRDLDDAARQRLREARQSLTFTRTCRLFFFIHGTEDITVPLAQSVDHGRRSAELPARHRLQSVRIRARAGGRGA